MRGLSLVVVSGGHSSSRCAGLSLSRPLPLRSTGSRRAGSAVVAHGPSCSAACGIPPDQGLNPCPLHWQADSQPLGHQGSPSSWVFIWFCQMLFLYLLIWSCAFSFLACSYDVTLINFQKVYLPCIPGINPTWSWCIILFIDIWIYLLIFCWRFLLCIHKRYWFIVFFSCNACDWFWLG